MLLRVQAKTADGAILKEICEMKALYRTTIYAWLLTAFSGSALGQNIQIDFDHQADFSQYRTYSWQAVNAADSIWDDRIKNAVNGQLGTRACTQADNCADFSLPPPQPPAAAPPEPTWPCHSPERCVAIVAMQTTQTRRTLQTLYDGLGDGWLWRGQRDFCEANTIQRDYMDGTLVIDMYDTKTKRLLWRGSAEGVLSYRAETNKKLEKAVAKMLEDFPPNRFDTRKKDRAAVHQGSISAASCACRLGTMNSGVCGMPQEYGLADSRHEPCKASLPAAQRTLATSTGSRPAKRLPSSA
jgi:hypothetical protein